MFETKVSLVAEMGINGLGRLCAALNITPLASLSYYILGLSLKVVPKYLSKSIGREIGKVRGIVACWREAVPLTFPLLSIPTP
ncbi:hypothetical protein MiSe_72470 [Microseira wollei NIES-4236]|uniref:Transposase n=1 Tax=Microseira wollei NIES-4236 TaxID=2530354 RepID=A0AAV3XQA7_9CYAN|nr:hypothetical protein MiSe_72470 [Microseira wollei NIES-4236]